MNGKQLACIVLMMIIGAVLYTIQIVHNKAADAIQAAADEQEAEKLAADDLEMTKVRLERGKFNAQELERFLAAWKPFINRLGSRQEVETALQATTRESGVFVVNQRFEDKVMAERRMMPRSVLATMTVEDEYSKTLNWLGELERKVPLARVTSCRLSSAGSGRQVHIEVAMEVPLIDLSVNPLGAVEKKKK